MSEITDKNLLNRFAQNLVVEARPCSQTSGYGQWFFVPGARVEQVTLNAGAKPNVAVIRFPALRWNEMVPGLDHGVNLRIRTDAPARKDGSAYRGISRAVLFQGFLTRYKSRFAGVPSGTETNEIVCMDTRWLMATTSVVFGTYARSRDDYDSTLTDSANSATFFSGRRCIFNQGGKPNRDAVDAVTVTANGDAIYIPVFANEVYADPQPWTVRHMLQYLLSPYLNRMYPLFPIDDVTALVGLVTGLDHSDFDRVINHVVVDTLDVMGAVDRILRNIGWSLREQYSFTGPEWVFYKPAAATGDMRDITIPTILHTLHAPAPNEIITAAVAAGRKLLYAAEFDEDITAVINTPVGLGSPERYEFTAELVPAWLDSDLTPPDSANDYDAVFVTEAALQASTSPNSYDFYKYYHTAGSSFKRDVGRKWALNEAGDYSGSTTFDRGMPFEFSDVLDRDDAVSSDTGRRRYGLFRRALLECLTFDTSDLNSVGIKIEFSFDAGTTWFTPQVSARVLTDECGIYIEDPNLSEILSPVAGTIDDAGGDLDGKELNYWTSLCWDKLDENSFKNGEWFTRCRVTASVQMDQRLLAWSLPTANSGSPFRHQRCYDFSDQYTYSRRTDSSIFEASGELDAWNTDEYEKMTAHLDALRDANEDMSINGRFTLDRLWLGDGSGSEDFRIGDGISGLTGREYSMAADLNEATVFPEIVQITYDVQRQKQHLVTRDLRLADMRTG